MHNNLRIGIIGAGSMGAGIAQVAACAGHPVVLIDNRLEAAEKALRTMAKDLAGAVTRQRMTAAEADQAVARVRIGAQLADLRDADLVIEAAVEQLPVKQKILGELEQHVSPQAILATNTSSLSITAVAQGLQHPERLAGLHFFNPATRMKLVEVIGGVATRPDVLVTLHELARAWGKTTVDAPNAPGFIVNRVARPYYAEGLRLAAERIAPIPVIDGLLRQAGGFAMGPFQLMDLIGVEVNLSVTESVFQATAFDGRFAPHLIQQELARSGRHGRKTGHGFYAYGDVAEAAPLPTIEPAGAVPALRVATQAGPLGALWARLAEAGVTVQTDAALAPDTAALGDVRVALTDGRTAAQIAWESGQPALVLDLTLDWGKTPCLAVAASQQAEAALPGLAAACRAAGIDVVPVQDVAGLIVMRTVACLANEAADLMTWTPTRAADIDVAMKLGTAYPKGPLAWADEVGPHRVLTVLQNLQSHYGDARYRQAPALKRAVYNAGALHV